MKRGGFTLLEVMIVLVIIAVLAGLAIPASMSAAEKSRKLEALQALGTIRQSQQRYFSEHTEYAANYSQLDYDPNQAVTGNVPHYAYTLSGGGLSSVTFTAIATRNATERPASVGDYTVSIDQDGTVASTY